MHDPMVVAFQIARPWPRRIRGGKPRARWYWPAVVTVWHVEPGGHDAGEVCPHYRKPLRADGRHEMVLLNGWRFHVHHWRFQFPPLQDLRRWALTRCSWCGGRSSKKNGRVNVSHQWSGPRGRWWRGEPGLFHMDCSSAEAAHSTCVCEAPLFAEHKGWGRCAFCGKFRPHGRTDEQMQRVRQLAAVPHGSRPAAACPGTPSSSA